MKRETSRELKLPSFSISIDELSVLINQIKEHFSNQDGIVISIEISMRNEIFRFDSVEELTSYPTIAESVTNFSVFVSQIGNDRRIYIRSGHFFNGYRSTASATSDSDIWCVGAIEVVRSFFQSRKLWYHWFLVTPFGWILFFVATTPSILLKIAPETKMESSVGFAWLAIVLTIFVLWIGKGRLLPNSKLRLSETDGFFRKRVPELSLLLAFISVVLTVLGWFVDK